MSALMSGCATTPEPCTPVTVEVPVVERVAVPAECLMPCLVAGGVPRTNGALLEGYVARGEALACYQARLECVAAASR